jgi:hypothetical protein
LPGPAGPAINLISDGAPAAQIEVADAEIGPLGGPLGGLQGLLQGGQQRFFDVVEYSGQGVSLYDDFFS